MPIGLGTAIAIGAGTAAIGTVASGVMQSNAIDSAANTSAQAAREGQGEQARQFNISQEAMRTGVANANVAQAGMRDATLGTLGDLYGKSQATNQPYLTTGNSALSRLAQIYGLDSTDEGGNTVKGVPGQNVNPNDTFWQSPDYQYTLEQGIRGVNAGAQARGMFDSGATRKAEIKYAGNLASSQFGNYASRLAQLAQVGHNAAGTAINTNQNYGGAVANANNAFATQYGNSQLGLGTNLADLGTTYGNNYASSVQNAANTQANAALSQGANTSNMINGVAGAASNFLTSGAGKSVFGSSYNPIDYGIY